MSEKNILVLLPYENIYPPLNGGMLRCFHVLHQLSKYFKVTVIMHQDAKSFMAASEIYPEIEKVTVYSTRECRHQNDIFSLLPSKLQGALRYRWLQRTWKGPADSHFLSYYRLLKTLLKTNRYEFVLLENLATLKATPVIRKYQKTACVIYDAHNVDSNLAREEMTQGLIRESVYQNILHAESSLHKVVDGVITCSKNDLDTFFVLNKTRLKADVIPNGVPLFPGNWNDGVLLNKPRTIIFCGSLGYEPNSKGLSWFYNSIWPIIQGTIPDIRLLVVGSGRPAPVLDMLKNDPAILFTGVVTDVKKYYNQAAVAIVPLLSGSGTRLKILEAMSLGVPVISTMKGAEGIGYKADKDILIGDDEKSFASQLIKLLLYKNLRLSVAENARELIETKYAWNIIGKKMYHFMSEELP